MRRKISFTARKAALSFVDYLKEKREKEKNKKFFREYNGKIKEEKNFNDYYYYIAACQSMTNLYFYY